MAGPHSIRRAVLIIESTFSSLPDLAAELYPYLPVKLLLRFDYDTVAYLRRVQHPVLIVHSRDDEIIPVQHGRRLFAAAPQPKSFLELRGSHNTGFLSSGTRYEAGLDAFLATLDTAQPSHRSKKREEKSNVKGQKSNVKTKKHTDFCEALLSRATVSRTYSLKRLLKNCCERRETQARGGEKPECTPST